MIPKTLEEIVKEFPKNDFCLEAFRNFRQKKLKCPECDHKKLYWLSTKKQFKCKSCDKRFSLYSGTIFENYKIDFRTQLILIYIKHKVDNPNLSIITRLLKHKRYMTIYEYFHHINKRINKELFEFIEKLAERPNNHFAGSGRDRADNDFYPTPVYAVEALLAKEKFEGTVWEPCCGTGNISKTLIKHGFEVFSSDLIDRGYGNIIDFLKDDKTFQTYDNIITNPPFRDAENFLIQSKKYTRKKIALLLRTSFLEGVNRQPLLTDKEFGLKKVYQFIRRVTMHKEGLDKNNSGMLAFCWLIFSRENNEGRKPEIDWI